MAAGARIPRPAGTLAGAPPPWSGLPEDRRRSISVDEVRQALIALPEALEAGAPAPARRPVTPAELPAGADARPAAVLCLLFEDDGEANVVLTRRSAHLRSHSGEVSFPGGACSPVSHPFTPLCGRPSEEIGIDAGAVEVIGRVDPAHDDPQPGPRALLRRLFPHGGAGELGVRLRPGRSREGVLGAFGRAGGRRASTTRSSGPPPKTTEGLCSVRCRFSVSRTTWCGGQQGGC